MRNLPQRKEIFIHGTIVAVEVPINPPGDELHQVKTLHEPIGVIGQAAE